ncbi:PREDICTED: uncharacterized protein LOC109463354, partial [Branchiostoma belcheri]|uniref:Uncharacterized protein LOC109463354 n=1 Tax=Branchiostoma belcheri TaxID=7741 RepID=A0A6P4XGM4_BRABE
MFSANITLSAIVIIVFSYKTFKADATSPEDVILDANPTQAPRKLYTELLLAPRLTHLGCVELVTGQWAGTTEDWLVTPVDSGFMPTARAWIQNFTSTMRISETTSPGTVPSVGTRTSSPGKKADILNMIDSVRPDIIIATETWLDATVYDSEILPDTYRAYRRDRNKNGGGVIVAVRTTLKSSDVPELQVDNCEVIWVRVKLQGRKTLYVCAYYRPDVSDRASLEGFNASVSKAAQIPNAHLLIGGDMNLPCWDWTTMQMKPNPRYPGLHNMFIDILGDHGLEQLVDMPTRGENILDLIVTNNPQLIPRVEVLPGLSDHDAVFCEVIVHPQKRKQNPRLLPLYKKADWDSIRKSMADLTDRMELMKDTATTEELWSTFKDSLQTAVQEFIPHKLVRMKENKPWITPALHRLIKRRDRIYKKMRKRGTQDLKNQYKKLRREVQRQLRRAYWSYLDSIFVEDESGQGDKNKKFWTYIKHQKSSNVGIAALRDGGRLVSDPKEQADILNRQFHSVFGDGKAYSKEEFQDKCDMPPADYPILDK